MYFKHACSFFDPYTEIDFLTADLSNYIYQLSRYQNPKSLRQIILIQIIFQGYFDLSEEDNTLNQTVHLKWKGVEIGSLRISVDLQKLVVVN